MLQDSDDSDYDDESENQANSRKNSTESQNSFGTYNRVLGFTKIQINFQDLSCQHLQEKNPGKHG